MSSKKTQAWQVGYMPLILNPAHEKTTLNTVLARCIALGDTLNYKHVVLTVDQNLFSPLLELKWDNQTFNERVIVRTGGLHIAMNYLRAIGQHIASSGFLEAWVEAGLRTCHRELSRKSFTG